MTAATKCVFSFGRNIVSDEADEMSSGRQFHSFGPAQTTGVSMQS